VPRRSRIEAHSGLHERMLSLYSRGGSRQEAMALANAILDKPISLATMKRWVKQNKELLANLRPKIHSPPPVEVLPVHGPERPKVEDVRQIQRETAEVVKIGKAARDSDAEVLLDWCREELRVSVERLALVADQSKDDWVRVKAHEARSEILFELMDEASDEVMQRQMLEAS